jgi:SAM-dependent methyltransferase
VSAEAIASGLIRSLDGLTLRHGIWTRENAEIATEDSWAMRLMHAGAVVRVYESWWRPALVRLFSPLTYVAEDEIVERHLRSRSAPRLLDLCCGTARASRRWISHGAEVLAIDTSMAMLHEARRRCPSERLVLAYSDAGSNIARPQSFDAAMCFAALHLLPDPEPVLAHAVEALRPDGVLFAWVAAARDALAYSPLRRTADLLGLRVWEPSALADRIERHGLQPVERLVFGTLELVVARRASG